MLLASIAQGLGAKEAGQYQTPGEEWAETVENMQATPAERRASRDAEVAAFIAQAGG
jgi:hypothetical protein